jgi:hypothetical protein
MRTPPSFVMTLVVAVALIAGCSSGPAEDQLLPEKDLSFPGATLESRTFEEEHHATKIDGGSIDRPATLSANFRAPTGTAFSDVITWYRQQLEPKDWRADQGPHDEHDIEFVRTTDGLDHKIRVYRAGGPPELYDVDYELRERP